MPLNNDDYLNILSGFFSRLNMRERQSNLTNPINLQIPIRGQDHTFRLWCFEVTHGGGGPQVRAKNEYRVQVTKGPSSLDDFDRGATEILIGYARDQNVIVAYDRCWLRQYARTKQENPESRPSPSAQVKTEQIIQGKIQGIYHFKKKTTNYGYADIVTLTPDNLPNFLGDYQDYLRD